MEMLRTVAKAWNIPDIRKKIIFTLCMLLIFRIGAQIPVPGMDFMPEPCPGCQNRENQIKNADAEYSPPKRPPEKAVFFVNRKRDRGKERRAVDQGVQKKRNPQIQGTAFLRINNLGNAHGRHRPGCISDNGKDKPREPSGYFTLRPDLQAVRRNQDDRADDRQPEIAQPGISRAALAAQLHGEADDQEDRDKVSAQQIGHGPALSFHNH